MDNFYNHGSFGPHISIGYLLRRATKLATTRATAAFEGSDTSFTQWIVLALIFSGTAQSCADLSRDLGHDSGAMSRVIDQLEKLALLSRQRDDDDRRVTRLSLTDSGHATVTDLATRIIDMWNDLLQDFDHAEISQLITTLNKLVDRLDAAEKQAGR